jgi:hypothetical protein
VTARRAALLAAGWLAVAGCRTLPAAIPLPPDDPRPADLLAALSSSAQERRGLRGRARLAVESDARDVHVRGNLVLVIERPARLRVEVLGALGQAVAVLVSDGGRYEWFDSRDHSYRSGPVHRDLLWEVVRVPLAPGEVVDLVLGEPLPRPGLSVRGASRIGEREIHVELADGGGALRERVVFDADAKLRAGELLAAPGVLERRTRFDDYAEEGGVSFPRLIAVEFPGIDVRAELRLSDVELNPDAPAELFRLRAGAPAPPERG